MANITRRLIADLILLISVVLLPWWLSAPIAIIFLFVFDSYYEILIAGLIIDSLYPHSFIIPRISIGFTFLAAVVFLASFPIKRNLKFY